MGAYTFDIVQAAATPEQAFALAVTEGKRAHGEEGQEGASLGKKHGFVLASKATLSKADANALVNDIYDMASPGRHTDDYSELEDINEKDGPAGCIALEDGAFLLFGWTDR